jgi:hypothetical protein
MKKRPDREKIVHSSSQGRTNNKLSISSKIHFEKYSGLIWKSPKSNLITSSDLLESFDTCIFPSTDLSNSTIIKKPNDICTQTEDFGNCYENLHQENILLNKEILLLRNELDELKQAVKELQVSKNIEKMKNNEELIRYLEQENVELKKNILNKDCKK